MNDHQAEIEEERGQPSADPGAIRSWQREINAWKKEIDRILRRLQTGRTASAKSPTSTTVNVRTLELLLDEAIGAYQEMISLRRKLRRLQRGSEAYLDLLPDVWVCASVITAKTDVIMEEIDAIEDTLPDDDE